MQIAAVHRDAERDRLKHLLAEMKRTEVEAYRAERTPRELAVLAAIDRVSQHWRRVSVQMIIGVMSDAECDLFPPTEASLRVLVHRVLDGLEHKHVVRKGPRATRRRGSACPSARAGVIAVRGLRGMRRTPEQSAVSMSGRRK